MSALLSRQEAAERLAVSPQTVSRLIGQGRLDAIRVGVRKIAVSEVSIEQYLANCEVIPIKENEQ
jgi:excisionase family DNA binding protein